jgi:hypothetical protein
MQHAIFIVRFANEIPVMVTSGKFNMALYIENSVTGSMTQR